MVFGSRRLESVLEEGGTLRLYPMQGGTMRKIRGKTLRKRTGRPQISKTSGEYGSSRTPLFFLINQSLEEEITAQDEGLGLG